MTRALATAVDEQQREKQQATAEKHRRDEAILCVADPVLHDADEPEECNTGVRDERDRNQDPTSVSPVELGDVQIGRVVRNRQSEQHQAGTE